MDKATAHHLQLYVYTTSVYILPALTSVWQTGAWGVKQQQLV